MYAYPAGPAKYAKTLFTPISVKTLTNTDSPFQIITFDSFKTNLYEFNFWIFY
ncbi:hypothetical protein THOD04_50307 [Vibrio owensii]|nr:hypothetical protein THOD04_50307 [Vibrio owensii]